MRRVTADNPFPVITLIQSVKLWQKSYFYVKNLASDGDWVNLPPYSAVPLTGRLPSWSHRVKTLTPAGAAAIARLRVLMHSEVSSGPTCWPPSWRAEFSRSKAGLT